MSGPAPRQLFIYPEWRTSLQGLKLLGFSGCATVMLVKGFSVPDARPPAHATSAQQDRVYLY